MSDWAGQTALWAGLTVVGLLGWVVGARADERFPRLSLYILVAGIALIGLSVFGLSWSLCDAGACQ